MRKENGGPAFPHLSRQLDDQFSETLSDGGMTLRDYFAAKAMNGLLAQSGGSALSSDENVGAEYAYRMADAMLEARSK